MTNPSRRDFLLSAAALVAPLWGCRGREAVDAPKTAELSTERGRLPEDAGGTRRLLAWVEAVRASGLAAPDVSMGRTAVAVGEQALGTPYESQGLEAYLLEGGSPTRTEPLTLSLTRFDCVSLVESCLAIARVARRAHPPTWEAFAREMEQLRYRGGERRDYLSRLHYFSEWIDDNARRGGVEVLGEALGGVPDRRPLRFMTEHREAYPALEYPEVYGALQERERQLDGATRWVVPTARIPAIANRLRTGDVVAFATSIPGLDVTHSAFAYRGDDGVVRVLHAPLSGGVVEITGHSLHEYVRRIRRATGILVARPLPA